MSTVRRVGRPKIIDETLPKEIQDKLKEERRIARLDKAKIGRPKLNDPELTKEELSKLRAERKLKRMQARDEILSGMGMTVKPVGRPKVDQYKESMRKYCSECLALGIRKHASYVPLEPYLDKANYVKRGSKYVIPAREIACADHAEPGWIQLKDAVKIKTRFNFE